MSKFRVWGETTHWNPFRGLERPEVRGGDVLPEYCHESILFIQGPYPRFPVCVSDPAPGS